MKKLAVLAALPLALAAKPAAACTCDPCPPLFTGLAYALGAAMAGGYAYGTGYLVYHDVTDADQSMQYGGAEMMVNAAGTALFGGAMIDAVIHDQPGTALAVAPFAALHTGLMIHGGWRLVHERDEFQPPQHAMLWLEGAAFTTNALLWSAQLGDRHGRGYGVAEAAANAPLAAFLGYLAYDRFEHWHGGAGFAYGGMALVEGALAYHGIKTAIVPSPPQIDIDGLDLTPTIVDDGREQALGLGTARTW